MRRSCKRFYEYPWPSGCDFVACNRGAQCKTALILHCGRISHFLVKSKGKFLHSAVSNHQDCSKHFTLYFPDRPVQSDTISTSLGSIQPYATINARRLLVHIYPPLSIARYSFIQLSELEQFRVKKLAQGFNTAAHDSNPGSRNRESEALPLSHCALLLVPKLLRLKMLDQSGIVGAASVTLSVSIK